MTLSVSVPQLVNSSTSTKDQVISVLAYRWPLGAKQIFEEVKRNGGQEITYQAIHKCLTQLEEDTILEKADKNYQLNQKWITSLKQFANDLEMAYTTKQPVSLPQNFEGKFKLEFDDYSRMVVYLADIINRSILSKGKQHPGIGLMRHAFWPLEFKFQDFALLRSMIKNHVTGYVIIKENSLLDQWCAKQYLDVGFGGVLLDYDYGAKKDFVIHSPSIVEISHSDETTEYLDKVYNSVANISELFKLYLTQKKKPKMHSTFEIRQDEELANMLFERHVEIIKQQHKKLLNQVIPNDTK